MSVRFAYPAALALAALAVPACAFVAVRYRRLRDSLRALLPAGKDDSRGGIFGPAIAIRAAAWSLAWVCLVVAFAGPEWGSELVGERQEGASVVFAIDISRSMTVQDLRPSRLEFAARYASLTLDRVPGVPAGIVLAKGTGVLAVPLSVDHRAARDLLSSLSPLLSTSPGTNLSSALDAALRAFPASRPSAGIVVLITDGDETTGSLADAARELRATGRTLVIVGVGTEEGESIPTIPGNADSPPVRAVLREEILSRAAMAAGGRSRYLRATDPGSARELVDLIRSAADSGERMVYSPRAVARYAEFLAIALCLFALGFLLGRPRWRA
ncbi:MAG TPA: VWA domain-containing protein [Treponemataceae bacterium]|jgi:Ca-activated chloride channel family protein|nr:VWA domain-containing protein [Treponemataceae bacterium]